MQTPAPRPAPHDRPHDAPNDADDRTVLLTTEVIGQAAQAARPTPAPYRPRPYQPPPGQPYPATPPYPGARPYPGAQPYPPAAHSDNDHDDSDGTEKPTFSLTATQVVASMSAAVVAAFIGAQLGVAGTIVGAAIASIVSVVGSAVIGHSLLLTRRKVTQTVQHVRVGAGAPADAADTVLLTAVTRRVEIEPVTPPTRRTAPTTASVTAANSRRKGWWSRPGRLRWALVGLAASAAVFAAALGAVTVVEAVKGAPISGGESGFSVLGGTGGRSTGPAQAPSTEPSTVTETTTAPATTSTTSASSASSSTAATTSSSAAPSTTASTAPTTSTSAAPTTASSTPAAAPRTGPTAATTAD